MSKDRRLTLMRWALTRATSKWNTGGRVKSQGVKPVSLSPGVSRGEGRVPFMSRTFTTIYVVMRDGAPMGAYTDPGEALAHARAIRADKVVTLELVHGPRTDTDQADRLDQPDAGQAQRR